LGDLLPSCDDRMTSVTKAFLRPQILVSHTGFEKLESFFFFFTSSLFFSESFQAERQKSELDANGSFQTLSVAVRAGREHI
jgi:hypothetical protein